MRAMIDALRALGIDVNDDGRGTLPFGLVRHRPWWRAASSRSTRPPPASSCRASCCRAARFDARPAPHPHRRAAAESAAHRHDHRLRSRRGASMWTRPSPGPGSCTRDRSRRSTSTSSPTSPTPRRSWRRRWSPGGPSRSSRWPAQTTQVGASSPNCSPGSAPRCDTDDGALVVGRRCRASAGAKRAPGVDLDLSAGGELAPALVALAAPRRRPEPDHRHRPPARPRDRPPRGPRRRAERARRRRHRAGGRAGAASCGAPRRHLAHLRGPPDGDGRARSSDWRFPASCSTM